LDDAALATDAGYAAVRRVPAAAANELHSDGRHTARNGEELHAACERKRGRGEQLCVMMTTGNVVVVVD
jgi:hypothetical protein